LKAIARRQPFQDRQQRLRRRRARDYLAAGLGCEALYVRGRHRWTVVPGPDVGRSGFPDKDGTHDDIPGVERTNDLIIHHVLPSTLIVSDDQDRFPRLPRLRAEVLGGFDERFIDQCFAAEGLLVDVADDLRPDRLRVTRKGLDQLRSSGETHKRYFVPETQRAESLRALGAEIREVLRHAGADIKQNQDTNGLTLCHEVGDCLALPLVINDEVSRSQSAHSNALRVLNFDIDFDERNASFE
jgi:hypothetical protein